MFGVRVSVARKATVKPPGWVYGVPQSEHLRLPSQFAIPPEKLQDSVLSRCGEQATAGGLKVFLGIKHHCDRTIVSQVDLHISLENSLGCADVKALHLSDEFFIQRSGNIRRCC